MSRSGDKVSKEYTRMRSGETFRPGYVKDDDVLSILTLNKVTLTFVNKEP